MRAGAAVVLMLLAGCAGPDAGPGAGAGTGGTASLGPDAPEPTWLACRAQLGGALGGAGGPGGVSVAGCELGTAAGNATVVEVDVEPDCGVRYDVDGDGVTEGPVEAGATYASGTTFQMHCGPAAADAEGRVALRPA